MEIIKHAPLDPAASRLTGGTMAGTASLESVCTLASHDLAGRLEEIRDLARRALLRSERGERTLHLDFHPSAEGELTAIIEQESECCDFLSFDVDRQDHRLRVAVSVPDHAALAAHEILDAFEGRTPDGDTMKGGSRSVGLFGGAALAACAVCCAPLVLPMVAGLVATGGLAWVAAGAAGVMILAAAGLGVVIYRNRAARDASAMSDRGCGCGPDGIGARDAGGAPAPDGTPKGG